MNLRRVILRLIALPAPDAGWQVELVRPDGSELAPHRVRCTPVGAGAGPFAPSHVPWPASDPPVPPDAVEVLNLARACDRIVRRRAEPGDITRVGRALFDALLGETFWRDTVQPLAQGADWLELALEWPGEDPVLHRLNWELLHDTQGFLANGFKLEGRRINVAITRIVRRTKAAAPNPAPIPRAPRLLFVVGCRLSDPAVRAGAEFFGLLRRFEPGPAGWGPGGRGLTTRVLIEATAKRFAAAVEEFKPDLVHFVGHGDFVAEGAALRFEPDEAAAGPGVKAPYDFRTGQRLAQLLRWTPAKPGAPDRPAVVILSACLTGVTVSPAGQPLPSADGMAPLAAQLVAGGIPAVVGMAGRVTDVACRLFTGYFGEAILFGKPLVLAAEAGRRAGFREGSDPYLHADWAFPTLYLDAALPPEHAPAEALGKDVEDSQTQRFIRSWGVEREPVFAAWFEHLDTTYRAWLSGERSVLVLVGPETCGKARLLKEMALQALRDGHVPVLAVPRENQAVSTRRGVADLLYDALRRTCASLRLQPGDGAELPKLLQRPLYEATDLGQSASGPEPAVEPLLVALRLDLLTIAQLARQQHPGIAAAQGQPVLMLGRLDRWVADGFLTTLRDGGLEKLAIRGFGLPSDGDVVRVGVSFRSHSGPWDGVLKNLGEGAEPDWMYRCTLDYLPAGEDFEAATRMLLHAPRYAGKWLDEKEKIPYVVNPTVDPAGLANATNWLRKWTKLPGGFCSEGFAHWLQGACGLKVLEPASDEELLKRFRPWK